MGSFAVEPEMLPESLGRGDEIDFSKPCLFNLKTKRPNKTVDIGGHGLSLSLDAQGRVLQASTYHPKFGIMMANSFDQFDGSRFYDVPYVRAYRTRMLQWIREDRPGFGLDFQISRQDVSIKIVETNVALYNIKLGNIRLSIAVEVAEDGRFVQYAKATNIGTECEFLPFTWRLNVSLNRASYGQLTEGGPICLPPSRNDLQKIGTTSLRVCNPNLDAQLVAQLDTDGPSLDLHHVPEEHTSGTTLDAAMKGILHIPTGATATLRASSRLLPNTKQLGQQNDAFRSALCRPDIFQPSGTPRWQRDNILTTYVLSRNVEYILANCVVPVAESTAAIVTDHVALPLGWNRDNYWQSHLLLQTYANVIDLVTPQFVHLYQKKIRFAARGHINWVFTKAERPHGFWHRSYLVNGERKDRSIFQLDQQCYPLLELCDYLEYFPDELEFVKGIVGRGVIQEILAVLESKQDAKTQLWPTDETPGDDAVIYPHHFSSHVLLWRTFTRLHDLFVRLGIPRDSQTSRLGDLAADLKERTMRSFTSSHPSCAGYLFAYLTNGCGNFTFYHDGNDIPTSFAHEWGFVSTPDEICTWKNTMEFGLSPANTDGYCNESPYGGLGSVHSPGAWSLGYYQELAYAASTENVLVMQSAWNKIAVAMQWDGTFPEAVDPKTAKCTSKAWFSWPGAMIGALLIRMRKNGQEKLLLQNMHGKM